MDDRCVDHTNIPDEPEDDADGAGCSNLQLAPREQRPCRKYLHIAMLPIFVEHSRQVQYVRMKV